MNTTRVPKTSKQLTTEHIDRMIAQYFGDVTSSRKEGMTLGEFLEEYMFPIASDPVLQHFIQRATDPDRKKDAS